MKAIYKSILDCNVHFIEKCADSPDFSAAGDFSDKIGRIYPYIKFNNVKVECFKTAEDFEKAFAADEAKIYGFAVYDQLFGVYRECQLIKKSEFPARKNYDGINPKTQEHDNFRFDFSEFVIFFKEDEE